jgi:death on curing protein
MKYLLKNQVIRLNKATIDSHGGNYVPPANFLHEPNLDYLLEAVQIY